MSQLITSKDIFIQNKWVCQQKLTFFIVKIVIGI